MRPLSRCSDNVSSAGIGCNSISAGRRSGTRGSRPGLFEPAVAPLHLGGANAVLVLQNAADPYRRGHLVFGNADHLAAQVLRALDAAVGSDIDRRVTEQPRRKHRDADIRASALRHQVHRVRQRQFGDVELLVAEGAVERFLRRHRTADRLAAIDADRPVEDRACPVVIDAGDADCQFRHSLSLAGLARNSSAGPATTAWSVPGTGSAPA